MVGDVRGAGYFFGIELVKDKKTKETFDDAEGKRLLSEFISPKLWENGLYCRADDRGEPVIQLAPPLTIGQPVFDDIEQILRDVISQAIELLYITQTRRMIRCRHISPPTIHTAMSLKMIH